MTFALQFALAYIAGGLIVVAGMLLFIHFDSKKGPTMTRLEIRGSTPDARTRFAYQLIDAGVRDLLPIRAAIEDGQAYETETPPVELADVVRRLGQHCGSTDTRVCLRLREQPALRVVQ